MAKKKSKHKTNSSNKKPMSIQEYIDKEVYKDDDVKKDDKSIEEQFEEEVSIYNHTISDEDTRELDNSFLDSKDKKKKTNKEKDISKKEIVKDKVNEEENIKKDIVDSKEKIKKEDIDIDKNINKEKKIIKSKKHPIINLLLVILLIIGTLYFICNLFFNNSNQNALFILINSLLIILFTIFFVISGFISRNNNKTSIGISSILLILYFLFNIGINTGFISLNTFSKVEDFSGVELTKVIKWASKNNISIDQEYEYSDMVSEYSVISQSVKAGTNIKDINSIKVAVSDGANPSKDVVIPNMVTWDVDRVSEFVKENYLSNVTVEFVSSEEAENTVIEQSMTGNMKRCDELKLTFSYGEELGYDEVKLSDLKNKSKFEVELYFKQHQINYELIDGYSKSIKKGYAYKQSVKAGDTVSVNHTTVKVYISKGPKIKVPELSNMSLEDITNWVIKNRLKIKVTDNYNSDIKKNDVISTSVKKGDSLSQGDTVEVVISKGGLKMPKFNSLNDFKDWADKYSIKYEIQNEFSNTVKAGEVISYSYKTGDTIKNDDTIIVKVSDGEKIEVPNLKGMTKDEAIKALKKVGLNYNFVTKSSDSIAEGKVISQSLSAGSEVSKNSTVTVTISSGKSVQKKESTSSSSSKNTSGSSSSNSSSKSSSSSSSSGGSSSSSSTSSCTPVTYTVGRGLNTIFNNYSGSSAVSSAIYSYYATNYPNVKITVKTEDGGDATSGSYLGGTGGPGSTITSCNSTPYTIIIAE